MRHDQRAQPCIGAVRGGQPAEAAAPGLASGAACAVAGQPAAASSPLHSARRPRSAMHANRGARACRARPKEKDRVQGFFTPSIMFMAARCAVASSSDWPPVRRRRWGWGQARRSGAGKGERNRQGEEPRASGNAGEEAELVGMGSQKPELCTPAGSRSPAAASSSKQAAAAAAPALTRQEHDARHGGGHGTRECAGGEVAGGGDVGLGALGT